MNSFIPNIYRSYSPDPFFNLALEEWFLRNRKELKKILFIYCNSPSVIIGRNQNPWQECNLFELISKDTPILRRCSGGGTVYHDLGNCNYSLIGDRSEYKPQDHLKLAVKALSEFAIPARITQRNDVCLEEYKISGSAFTLTGHRALQHGTMLINSDLKQMKQALTPGAHLLNNITTRAVPSTPAKVMNLKQYKPELTNAEFEDALIEVFRQELEIKKTPVKEIYPEDHTDFPGLATFLEKYRADHWQIGHTPPFTLTLPIFRSKNGLVNWRLETKKGRITNAVLETGDKPQPPWSSRLNQAMKNVLFWPENLQAKIGEIIQASEDEDQEEIRNAAAYLYPLT